MLKFRRSIAGGAALLLLLTTVPAYARGAQPHQLSFEDAVRMALAQNPSYKQSATQIASAESAVRQARAARGVNVDVQEYAQYSNPVAQLTTPFGALPFSPSTFNSTPLLTARFLAYDGGLSAAHIGQAEAQLAQAQATVNQSRQQTVDTVAKAYYQLAAAFAMQQVARQSVGVAARHLKDAQLRFRAGTVPRAEVLRAQTDLADQEVAQIDADNQQALAQSSLDQIMGVDQGELHLPISSLDAKAPAIALTSLIQASEMKRPDLAAALSAVNIAKEAVAAAQAAHRPQVTLTASDGNVQPPIQTGFHNQFTVGLNAVWTLFDSGYNRAAVAQAQAGMAGATLAVANLQSQVELQVREAYLNVHAAQAKVDAAHRLVAFADENLRLAQVRSEGGVGTPLEVQDAAQRDRDAHRALVQSQVDVQSALVDLRLAAGLL